MGRFVELLYSNQRVCREVDLRRLATRTHQCHQQEHRPGQSGHHW